MGKPSHICETISMLGIASLVFEFGGLLMSEVSMCFHTSLRLLFALCVSSVTSFVGLLCVVVGGVLSTRLMASNQEVEVMVWCGPARNSSCDIESWRELPPCSGETSSSCISIS